MKRLFNAFYLITLSSNSFLLIFSIFIYANGSLEEFPTKEQVEKARIFSSCMIIVFSAIEFFFILHLRKHFKKGRRKYFPTERIE